MGNNLKILHLSDPHVGYKKCGQRFRTIAWNVISREKPDEIIIVITGDLVENAFQQEQLDEALGVLNIFKKAGFEVLVCPGNHDYGNGWINDENISKKFNKLFLSSNSDFPIVRIIDNMVFICLDSNMGELHWYDRFFADGEIGDIQLEKLSNIVDREDFKDKIKIVYLHHHPIDLVPFHKLKDHQKLREIIQNKVDLVLYGHNHVGKNHSGKWGIKIMLDGGSSTGKRSFGRKIRHRIINLNDFSIQEKNYLDIKGGKLR